MRLIEKSTAILLFFMTVLLSTTAAEVAVLMTQTANNEARADFETAVMQAIVEPVEGK